MKRMIELMPVNGVSCFHNGLEIPVECTIVRKFGDSNLVKHLLITFGNKISIISVIKERLISIIDERDQVMSVDEIISFLDSFDIPLFN